MRIICLVISAFVFFSAFSIPKGKFYKELRSYVEGVVSEMDQLPPQTQSRLEDIGDYIINKIKNGDKAHILLVSKENSRRSHMAQLWFMAAAAHYEVQNVHSFSGGVEPSSFDIRTANALKRAGVKMSKNREIYTLKIGTTYPSFLMYSKRYDDVQNPKSDFLALVLSEVADKQLSPFPGADKKITISYEDMEKHDGQPNEDEVYDRGCREMAREMFYLFSYVKNKMGS